VRLVVLELDPSVFVKVDVSVTVLVLLEVTVWREVAVFVDVKV
jgi:hypothetical protein